MDSVLESVEDLAGLKEENIDMDLESKILVSSRTRSIHSSLETVFPHCRRKNALSGEHHAP